MKNEECKEQRSKFNLLKNILITNSIRLLAAIAKTFIFVFTSVDALLYIAFEQSNFDLIVIIMNNSGSFYYPVKNRCRLFAEHGSQLVLLPI